VGRVPRDEALGWIAGASVLLSSSRDEGAPTSIREARALGVPVVTCDAGDVALWAQRDPGIRVVGPDVASIAAGLEATLARLRVGSSHAPSEQRV
jgi:glycosyltransferase involved in cell wall biosynthesis